MRDQSAHPVYRALIWLYPPDFRNHYRDDLVQSFTDLTRDRGPGQAWARTTLDLIVTVPRYRMETLMKEEHSASILTGLIVLLGAVGIISVPLGISPGILLLPLAIGLGIAQRSKLARAMDVRKGNDIRRRRLRIAGVLMASLPVIYLVSLPILGDSWGLDATIAFSLWFIVLIVAVGYFIAGISTPRSPVTSP
jgi:choline-glycine betaine transporter